MFETQLKWKEGKQANLNARENPLLQVGTPPDFGGPQHTWSPEELFIASIESCLMSTFLYFVDRFHLSMTEYSSQSKGDLTKTADGLRFSKVEIRIVMSWADEESHKKANSLNLKEKLEKYCPVSNSVDCPITIRIDMQ